MRIRLYEDRDRETVVALSTRLTVGVAPWRDQDAVRSAARAWVAGAVEEYEPTTRPVYVAEDSDGALVGFISVGTHTHWTGEKDAYVGELVVAEAAARQGTGRALMRAAQDWGRNAGHTRLSLETGAGNQVARAFYASLGFHEEDVRLSVSIADRS